jgi:hypothetical protein
MPSFVSVSPGKSGSGEDVLIIAIGRKPSESTDWLQSKVAANLHPTRL